MIRINQAALVETVGQFLTEDTTWHFSGDIPDVLTEECFKRIKWLKKGSVIDGTEQSLKSPVSFSKLSEVYSSNRQKFMYSEARKNHYPSLAEQLDMLWHAINQDSLDKSCEFYTILKSVKDKYPKPE